MINKTLKEITEMIKACELDKEYYHKKIKGVSKDTRTINKGELYIPIIGENFDGHDFIKSAIEKGASASLWNKDHAIPDIDFPFILVEDTLKAVQKLSKEYRNGLDIKVVGITGSNGKTSTKDILSSILKEKYKTYKTEGNLNNELGVPLTLLSLDKNTEVAVIEMGMSSLGEIEVLTKLSNPDAAIITNIGTAHLQDLKTKNNIIKAKLEILKGLKKDGLFVYHGDDADLKRAVKKKNIMQEAISFGIGDSNDYVIEEVSTDKEGMYFKIKNKINADFFLPMLGNHQILNASSAIAISKYFEMEDQDIQKGLNNLELTSMRNELIHGNGFDILNDSYNSNPDSSKAVLKTLYSLSDYNQKILIFGDMLELGDREIEMHREIGRLIDFDNIDYLLTFGDLAKHTAQEAKNNTKEERVFSFDDKNKLNSKLNKILENNSIVVLKGSRGMQLEDIAKELLA